MARVNRFDYKFPGMRKPDNFIVYPGTRRNGIFVQGSRTVALLFADGHGILNFKGSHRKYAIHLDTALGAERVTFPPDFIELVHKHQPSVGDEVGPGVTLG